MNTIRVQTDVPTKEGLASGAITPGHLLERTSTVDTVKVHATEGIRSGILFAIEDGWQGREIDTAYASAERVFFIAPQRGDVVLGRIANGENIAIGDLLISNGDGTLKEYTASSAAVAGAEGVVGVALEACDMSSSSGADPDGKCKIEIW